MASITTVIVGAGVIGLCTAYQLAKAIDQSSNKHKHDTIVIEAADGVFPATSSTNTGILSYSGFKEDLQALAQYSYKQWESLARDGEHFGRDCGYKEGVNIALKPGSGEGSALLPDWIQADQKWDAQPEPKDGKTAIINPIALGQWLKQQCSLYGVELKSNTEVLSANPTTTGHVLSLNVRDGEQTIGQKASTITCDKLVFAAGPWTPTLLKALFPESSVSFDPVISAGDWIACEYPVGASTQPVSAVYFNDIVDHKLEFAGRNDGYVWVTGQKSQKGEVPPLEIPAQADAASIAKLTTYAERFLKHPQQSEKGLPVVSQGQAYRPETQKQRPVIGPIPVCKLFVDGSFKDGSNVLVNAGHGSYGVTLGMGSGKIMSQMILGGEMDLDISHMAP